MNRQESIQYSEGVVWLDRGHGIVRIELVPGTYQTLTHAKEQIAALQQLSGGARRPVLVDFRGAKGTDKDARAYFDSAESRKAWSACALLTGTPLSNAIANAWIDVHGDPENPVKLFTSEFDAIAWLKSAL